MASHAAVLGRQIDNNHVDLRVIQFVQCCIHTGCITNRFIRHVNDDHRLDFNAAFSMRPTLGADDDIDNNRSQPTRLTAPWRFFASASGCRETTIFARGA